MQIKDDILLADECEENGHLPVYYSRVNPVKSCNCGKITEGLNGIELALWWLKTHAQKNK